MDRLAGAMRWLLAVVLGILIATVAVAGLGGASTNAIWAPAVAAIGASGLTAVAAIGIELARERRTTKSGLRQERRAAYARFLTASADYVMVAGELRQIKGLSSGITAKVRISEPIEFMQRFNDRMARPLMHAWSGVWLSGSSEAILAANRVVNATIPVTDTVTERGQGRHPALATFQGEKWTEEQQEHFQSAMREVGIRRTEFAEVARKEMGNEVVDLLAGLPPQAAPDVGASGTPPTDSRSA